jgi:hypothetical protein
VIDQLVADSAFSPRSQEAMLWQGGGRAGCRVADVDVWLFAVGEPMPAAVPLAPETVLILSHLALPACGVSPIEAAGVLGASVSSKPSGMSVKRSDMASLYEAVLVLARLVHRYDEEICVGKDWSRQTFPHGRRAEVRRRCGYHRLQRS